MSDTTEPLDLNALRKRYTADEPKPCRVCGGPLSIQSMGGGQATEWACSDRPHRQEGDPNDLEWYEHYRQSKWTQFRGGDLDVLDALAELVQARADLASLGHWWCPNCEAVADVIDDDFCLRCSSQVEWCEPDTLSRAKAYAEKVKRARDEAWAEVERLSAALQVCEHALTRAEPTDAQVYAGQQASGAYWSDWTPERVRRDLPDFRFLDADAVAEARAEAAGSVPDGGRPVSDVDEPGLYPTPTRLADLRDAGRQMVFRLPSGETRLYFDDGTYRTVNARFGELEAAGWVRVGGELHAARPAQRRWRYLDLTAAGRAVLAAAESPGGAR